MCNVFYAQIFNIHKHNISNKVFSDQDQKMEMDIGDDEDGIDFEDNILQDDDDDEGLGIAEE